MSSNFFIGVCVALGILGTWNSWTLYQVNQRLNVIEQMTPPPSNGASNNTTDATKFSSNQQTPNERLKEVQQVAQKKVSSTGNVNEQPTLDLMDPEIQETIAKIAESNAQKKEEQRRKSKMEAYKTSLNYELEQFSSEKEYDADTVQNIEGILDDVTAEWRAVREQVQEGEISWIDARTEFSAIGEETKERVTEFISEDDYTELRSRLWGDWGR